MLQPGGSWLEQKLKIHVILLILFVVELKISCSNSQKIVKVQANSGLRPNSGSAAGGRAELMSHHTVDIDSSQGEFDTIFAEPLQ